LSLSPARGTPPNRRNPFPPIPSRQLIPAPTDTNAPPPPQFQIGAGKVIKGFDKAVTGLAVGETRKVTDCWVSEGVGVG